MSRASSPCKQFVPLRSMRSGIASSTAARLVEPTLIDDAVLRVHRQNSRRSRPSTHRRSAASTLRRAFSAVPQVAVFDTAFHVTIAREASTYAVPRIWREDWGIRRYGFHGLSVQWCSERAPELLGRSQADLRLVVCHLGGGCSVTAVRDGRSVDTTMGFSPLEGVPMATRSGSIDPGALLFVQRAHGLSVDDVDRTWTRSRGSRVCPEEEVFVRSRRRLGTTSRRSSRSVYTYRIAGAVAAMAAAGARSRRARLHRRRRRALGARRADVCERLGFLGVELDRASERSTPTRTWRRRSRRFGCSSSPHAKSRHRTRGASAPPAGLAQ